MKKTELNEMLKKYVENKNALKALEVENEAISGAVKEYMKAKGLNVIACKNAFAELKNITRQSIDSGKLKENEPDIYGKYLKTITYSSLTVKGV